MLIADPDVYITWEEDGVKMQVVSYLYIQAQTLPERRGNAVDGELPFRFSIQISSSPTGYTMKLQDSILDYVLGAADTIWEWVAKEGLLDQWREEYATYQDVMSKVELPSVVGMGGSRSIWYTVPVEAGPGEFNLPNLKLHLGVSKEGATGILYLDTETEDSNEVVVCTYDTIPLPITLDSIKDIIRRPIGQYLTSSYLGA